jgi:glycosyltransferase involved in cell wall biosynthesis
MISVIVPAYNAAITLPACLEALRNQTLPPDEVIVVDDGSHDQTVQIARNFGVQVLEQAHQGPAVARNLGIDHARGDIILLTDADCEPMPTWIAEMLRPFDDPRVMGVKGSYRTHQREIVAQLVQCEFEERYDRLEQRETIDFIDTYSAAFRLAVLRKLGGFDPAFPQANNEDVELSYRLAHSGCRLMFNRQAIVYHRHPFTWRSYMIRKIKRGYWRMMVYKLYPDKAVRDSYTPQMLKVQIALIYLIVGLAVLAFIFLPLLWGVLAALISLWCSAIPFTRRARQQEKLPMIAALYFVFLRAVAFSIGVTCGMVGMIFFRPQLQNDREIQ